jgi:hypothetical protein
MNSYKIAGFDLAPYLWAQCSPFVPELLKIDRVLYAIDPRLKFSEGGPGHVSGCSWLFLTTPEGKPSKRGYEEFVVETDERWEVAASYRGPFLTAISQRDLAQREDQTPSPALVQLVKKLAADLGLVYLDAHELRALEIPWDELQGDAEARLDYSEMPNAFNLLFYEY